MFYTEKENNFNIPRAVWKIGAWKQEETEEFYIDDHTLESETG